MISYLKLKTLWNLILIFTKMKSTERYGMIINEADKRIRIII